MRQESTAIPRLISCASALSVISGLMFETTRVNSWLAEEVHIEQYAHLQPTLLCIHLLFSTFFAGKLVKSVRPYVRVDGRIFDGKYGVRDGISRNLESGS
jgi:hypothetical protein